MEIIRIDEVADLGTLIEYEILKVKTNRIRTEFGAVNIINFAEKEVQKITAFRSDSASSVFINGDEVDWDNKITLIFNDYIELNGEILILKNPSGAFFICETMNITHSPSNITEVSCIGVIQTLEDFYNSKKFTIKVIEEENKQQIPVYINPNFLLENVYEITNKGKKVVELEMFQNKWIPTMVHPVVVNNENVELYFSTFSKFSFLNINNLPVKRKGSYFVLDIPNFSHDYKYFFNRLIQIKNDQNFILNGYKGKTEAETKKFKEEKYNGTKVEEFTDYEIKKLFDSSFLPNETKKTIVWACSGFLKTTWAIQGGFTEVHRYIMPFYFETNGDDLTFESLQYKLISYTKEQLNYLKIDWTSSFWFQKSQLPQFPKLPKFLQEVNISVDFAQTSQDDLKHKLKIFSENFDGNIYKKFYSDIENPFSGFKVVENKKIFLPIFTYDLYSKPVTIEDIRREFYKHNEKYWEIASVPKVKKRTMTFWTRGNSADEDYKVVNENRVIWDKLYGYGHEFTNSTYVDFKFEEFNDLRPIKISSELDPEKSNYTFDISGVSGEVWYKNIFTVFELEVEAVKREPQNEEELFSSLKPSARVLLQNNFILNRFMFNDFVKDFFNENRPLNISKNNNWTESDFHLTIPKNKTFVISGVFLPEEIYIKTNQEEQKIKVFQNDLNTKMLINYV
ncbi:hypothetical protein [[Mycoplasma] gypis]|uniref:hypothetical protein n=1 Tax=[Mycoplasma] gypis TaxID=92404 RepID=UPI00196899E9|nr:hypothetical protein [[Mycoplasma] gypis]MBN0919680.1 hypothetical protein [[Mycoplasma] gypis]